MTRNKGNLLTVLIPAYNEEDTIGSLVQDVLALGPAYNVIVVDNHSTDMTAKYAKRAGATVVYEPRQGKGYAVRRGISYITTPYTILLDADGTYSPQFIPLFMESLAGEFNIVTGSRTQKDKGAMSQTNRVGNYLLTRLAVILYGLKVKDLCTGMWGFKTETLKKFSLTSSGFTLEADFYVNAVRSKEQIKCLPIYYKARPDGSISKLRLTDGLKIGWFLVKKRFR